jgi:hypothetical protein
LPTTTLQCTINIASLINRFGSLSRSSLVESRSFKRVEKKKNNLSAAAAAAHISTLSHFGSSSNAPPLFPPSAAVQESSLSSAVFLSPQEREIMADITLDPDDDPDPELFSGGAASAAAIGAWAWAALKNDNEDASRGAVSAPAQVCVSLLIYFAAPYVFFSRLA